MAAPRIRLIVRGDDAGSCASANRAVVQALDAGVLRNVSVMAPGPAFEEAANLLSGRVDVCLGLHVTLNAEWDSVKWGPVLPPERLRGALDADGRFLPTPADLNARAVDPDLLVAEVSAQLDAMRRARLHPSYLDEHMGVGWLPGLRERLADLAAREDLLLADRFSYLPGETAGQGDPVEALRDRLRAVPAGTYVFVTHPGIDADDMRVFRHAGLAPGQVALERDAERRLLTDPRLPGALQSVGVETVTYLEALNALPGAEASPFQ